MPLPVDYGTGTVTGTFTDTNGDPVVGTISFTPSASRLLGTGAVILGDPVVVPLDDAGSLTVILPASNDPNVLPTDFTYRVDETFVGTVGSTYFIEVLEGTTLDLSDVAVPGVVNNGTVIFEGVLPPQTGHDGEILRTDGTDPSWVDPGIVIADAPAKTIPVGSDKFVMSDSDDSDVAKRISFTDLSAAIGGGAVTSVNGQTGAVVLDADDIGDGTTNKAYTATEKTKLAGIATGATANQSDATTNAAIELKADLASPALTGNPTAPTQTAGNNSTRLATTAYVDTATASLNLPFVTGAYYSLSGGETSGTTTALNPAGLLEAHPVYLQAGNYDRIAMYVATAAVSTYRLGVYPNNAATYKPDGQSLILDAGTLNMNAGTGIQQITVTLAIPTSGIYWLAVLCDAYTAKPSIVGWAGNSGVVPNLPYFGNIMYGNVPGRGPFGVAATSVDTGAMPTTFPTTTRTDVLPQIMVRKAT